MFSEGIDRKKSEAWNGLKNPYFSEAVAQRCSVKQVFLEISQNLQENTCARVSGTGVFLWILQYF